MTRIIDTILMEKVQVMVGIVAEREPDVEWHTLTIEQNPNMYGSVIVKMDGKNPRSVNRHLETVMT